MKVTIYVLRLLLLVAQLCQTLCDPMVYSPPGSTVRGILQARILEWLAIPFSRDSSQPRNPTWVSRITSSDNFLERLFYLLTRSKGTG